MSWDIFIQDYGSYNKISEIPDDFKPKPFGNRDDIIKRMVEIYPEADFSDPSRGIIDADAFSIEISISGDQIVDSITLHVRGDKLDADYVAKIVKIIGQRAFDTGTGEFLDLNDPDLGFAKWRTYRNKHR